MEEVIENSRKNYTLTEYLTLWALLNVKDSEGNHVGTVKKDCAEKLGRPFSAVGLMRRKLIEWLESLPDDTKEAYVRKMGGAPSKFRIIAFNRGYRGGRRSKVDPFENMGSELLSEDFDPSSLLEALGGDDEEESEETQEEGVTAEDGGFDPDSLLDDEEDEDSV